MMKNASGRRGVAAGCKTGIIRLASSNQRKGNGNDLVVDSVGGGLLRNGDIGGHRGLPAGPDVQKEKKRRCRQVRTRLSRHIDDMPTTSQSAL